MTPFDWGIIVLLYVVAEVIAWFAWEKVAIKRAQDRASVTHQELEKALEQDNRESMERLAHAMRNHIEGPAHRRN